MIFSVLRAKPKVERILVSDPYFNEIARFRYKTYCEELNFLDSKKYPDEKETDEYDGNSIHIVVRVGKRLGGYARVIFPSDSKPLPIFKHFEIDGFSSSDGCEVSRFIVSKYYRNRTETRREIFRLLVEEIKEVVDENGAKSVYAVIEEWLLKSLRKRGIVVNEIGEPSSDYMNTKNYPVTVGID